MEKIKIGTKIVSTGMIEGTVKGQTYVVSFVENNLLDRHVVAGGFKFHTNFETFMLPEEWARRNDKLNAHTQKIMNFSKMTKRQQNKFLRDCREV